MRVIAGRLGGRRLVAPRGRGTRPTTDRVREALFSILGPLHGDAVLDLYAGTGALGIEALSRGATGAVFVESARAAQTALRGNLDELGLGDETQILATSVEASLRLLARLGPFDLVFADPPYADLASAMQCLAKLGPLGVLNQKARLIVEHDPKSPASAPGLELDQSRTYGDCALSFFRRA